ncbi:ABC transporter permease [Prolixibacteraceae bacterium Z1-6]|uniref:ABC transporter permease n=1 Tax=Draconibacterium aestuarii TaxID=2998507 RepID=A0A9X3F3T6_9BACT|nr:ABC transporter permease [Prolixibacteraceae bacterium Z1-6]
MGLVKISFRNLWKNKSTSLINLLGLTIALTSFVFIFMWVYHEVTFDRFHKNFKTIYMVASEWKYADGKSDFIMETPTPLGPYLKDNFPEVTQSTRFAKQFGGRFLESGDKKFKEQGLAVEPSFFDIFTIDFVSGDSKTIENNPNSIFISQRLADKFFGEDDPGNQMITFFVNEKSTKQYEIAGVYKDLPDNSSIQFDFLIPVAIEDADNWFAFGYSTFVLLPNQIDRAQLNNKIAQFYDYKRLGFDIDWYLHPIKDIHFKSDYQLFVYHPGDIQYVYIFSIAGVFILLIAMLNFMSLIGVLSTNRMKESGIRKISGAQKNKLAFSFLGEPLLLVSFSLIFTFALVETLQPAFNSFSGNNLPELHQNTVILVILFILALVIGTLSGILPGVFIASLKPIESIKQQKTVGNGTFRKYFIAFQFTLAIVLLSSTFLINKQLNYIFRKDLGFQKENIVHIPLKGKITEEYALIKHELLSNPAISDVTNASPLLSSGIELPGWTWDGISADEKHSIARIYADTDFLKTFGIHLILGNNFSEGNSNQVIINEEAAKVMSLKNPLHQYIQLKGVDYEIVGVVNNFHSRHLSHQIRPLVIIPDNNARNLYVQYKSGIDQASLITNINRVYTQFNPELPFEYHFFTDEFIATYRDEHRMLELLSYFVIVAFLILSFGLYALSKQVALSKTKEIGIRKVNGAKVSEILTMLNKDFVKWVAIAIVIAVPLAWYAMNKWLENFAYKTSLSWWIFAVAGVLALGIALLTVSWQSWRAATRNPVEALRYE